MRTSIRFVLALTLIACGGGEPNGGDPEPTAGGEAAGATFAGDVQAICDGPNELPPEAAEASPEERAVVLGELIQAQLQTPEGRELFQSLAQGTPAEKAARLRQAEGAPEPCALALEFDEAAERYGRGPAPGDEGGDEEPSVEPGGATGGDREPAAIAGVIRQHVNEVRYCYERELLRDPDLEGSLKVRFTIAADGTVAAAEITESLHATVDQCVKERVLGWTFGESDGVTVVNYPFVFAHSED